MPAWVCRLISPHAIVESDTLVGSDSSDARVGVPIIFRLLVSASPILKSYGSANGNRSNSTSSLPPLRCQHCSKNLVVLPWVCRSIFRLLVSASPILKSYGSDNKSQHVQPGPTSLDTLLRRLGGGPVRALSASRLTQLAGGPVRAPGAKCLTHES